MEKKHVIQLVDIISCFALAFVFCGVVDEGFPQLSDLMKTVILISGARVLAVVASFIFAWAEIKYNKYD